METRSISRTGLHVLPAPRNTALCRNPGSCRRAAGAADVGGTAVELRCGERDLSSRPGRYRQVTFVPAPGPYSTSTQGVLLAVVESSRLTRDDHWTADEASRRARARPRSADPQRTPIATRQFSGVSRRFSRQTGGFAAFGGFSSKVRPLVGKDEFGTMMKASYDS